MVNVRSLKQAWGAFSSKFTDAPEVDENDLEAVNSSTVEANQDVGRQEQEIEEKLQTLFENNDLLTSGKVSFINLNKIRIKLGSKWPKYEASVKLFAKQVIERRISLQDLYYKLDEDIYVFVFSNLSPEEATLKCALIAKEIGEQVFGDDWADEKYATTVAINQTDGSLLFKSGSLSESLLANLNSADHFDPAQILKEATPDKVEKDLKKVTMDLSKMESDLASIFGASGIGVPPGEIVQKFSTLVNNIQQLDSRLLDIKEISDYKVDDPQWVAFFNEGKKAFGSDQEDLSKKLMNMIGASERVYKLIQDNIFPHIDEDEECEEEETVDAVEPKGVDISEILLKQDPDLTFHYEPVWQPANNIINSYRAIGSILVENSAWDICEVTDSLDESFVALFDRLTFRRALVELHEGVLKGNICAMVIPVHFSTLNNQKFKAEYLEICNTFPVSYRRLLIWEIIKSNTGPWLSQLSAATSTIKPYGRMICLEIDISYPDFNGLSGAGVDAKGFSANIASSSGKSFLPKLWGFCHRADMHGLKTYILDIPSTNMALHAVAAGFDFLGGSVIAKSEEKPTGIKELSFTQMYDKNAKHV